MNEAVTIMKDGCDISSAMAGYRRADARTIRGLENDLQWILDGQGRAETDCYQVFRVVGGDGFEPPTPAL